MVTANEGNLSEAKLDALADAFERIRQACDANGLILGAHALDGKSAEQCIAWGCRYLSFGSNTLVFGQGARALYADLPAR